MELYIGLVYTGTAGIRRRYETKKQWNTSDPDGINACIILFAICGSILLQVFVKAHNISAKAREMTETKNYVTQAAELMEAGSYEIKIFKNILQKLMEKMEIINVILIRTGMRQRKQKQFIR